MTQPSESDASVAGKYTAAVSRSVLSEAAIYGVIVVSALIIVTGKATGASWEVFWKVAITIAVFYLAHVFASVVSHLGTAESGSFLHLLAFGFRHSSGMLIAALLPLGILALGASGIISEDAAEWTDLVLDIVILAIIGYAAVARMDEGFTQATARRRPHRGARPRDHAAESAHALEESQGVGLADDVVSVELPGAGDANARNTSPAMRNTIVATAGRRSA